MNLEEKINRNENFSEFSETKAINLKKLAEFFQDAIHFLNLKGRYQVNLQEKINRNENFSEFWDKSYKLEKARNFFKMQSISILAICRPRHLFLLLEH